MDTFASLAGHPVLSGVVCLPRRGAWHATLAVDAPDGTSLLGALDLRLDQGETCLVCARTQGGMAHGRLEVRVVGGKGGLGKLLPPKAYRGVPARTAVGDVLGSAGETLSPASDPNALAVQLPAWVRTEGSAGQALDRLALAMTAVWRVLPSGQVLVTREAWPKATAQGQALLEQPAEASAVLSLERLTLQPGETWEGRQVSRVEHTIAPAEIRTRVWFEP